ncbi:unnamed protein product [Owenia fusiformis]|uniref:Uncharacterized protein n=1 Tax=Owenia fusiformis TaxID=6347 RepID=A0A8J1Y884_OWEFU|nr:unnamed protein product [Owenia fusiformis]
MKGIIQGWRSDLDSPSKGKDQDKEEHPDKQFSVTATVEGPSNDKAVLVESSSSYTPCGKNIENWLLSPPSTDSPLSQEVSTDSNSPAKGADVHDSPQDKSNYDQPEFAQPQPAKFENLHLLVTSALEMMTDKVPAPTDLSTYRTLDTGDYESPTNLQPLKNTGTYLSNKRKCNSSDRVELKRVNLNYQADSVDPINRPATVTSEEMRAEVNTEPPQDVIFTELQAVVKSEITDDEHLNSTCLYSEIHNPIIPMNPHTDIADLTDREIQEPMIQLPKKKAVIKPRGLYNEGGPVGHELLPCKICGGKASGLHYGVNTCEACKAFFRKSQLKHTTYKCIGSGACHIGSGHKKGCTSCRYKKCIAQGMSKNAIRTGRYTYAKKNADIMLMKQMKQDAASAENDLIKEARIVMYEKITDELETASSLMDKGKQIEKVTQSKTGAAQLMERHAELHRLKQETFNIKQLSVQEYQDFYMKTGIDIDGRKSVAQDINDSVESSSQASLRFAQSIPFFSSLVKEDQLALVRGATVEMGALNSYSVYKKDSHIVLNHKLQPKHLDELTNILTKPQETIEMMDDTMSTLRSMDLQPNEMGLLKALCILISDPSNPKDKNGCTLKNPERVEEYRQATFEILLYWIKKQHARPYQILGKIMDFIWKCRQLRHKHTSEIQKIRKEYPNLDFMDRLPVL